VIIDPFDLTWDERAKWQGPLLPDRTPTPTVRDYAILMIIDGTATGIIGPFHSMRSVLRYRREATEPEYDGYIDPDTEYRVYDILNPEG